MAGAGAQLNFKKKCQATHVLLAIVLAASASIVAQTSQAATITPFSILYSKNLNGQLVVTGNSNMECPTDIDALGAAVTSTESANCLLARTRTGSVNYNNNAYRMIFAGGGTFAGVKMFNSSAADIIVPQGATIKSAFLFWHGDMSKPSAAEGGKAYNLDLPAGCVSANAFCRDSVYLVTPGTSTAAVIKAESMSSESATSGIWRAHADITNYFKSLTDSQWTDDTSAAKKFVNIRVGNIESAQGRDTQAGWSVILVYAHPDEELRNVVVYGGLAKIAQNDPAEVMLSDFETPPSGSDVHTTFGVVASEGDASEPGDFMELTSGATTTTVADAMNPPNNSANSTVSSNGIPQAFFNNAPGRYANLFGTDADLYALTNAIPNGATSANVRMGTRLETWYPIGFAVATELYSPELKIAKQAHTLAGIDVSQVLSGDTFTYQIDVTNISQSGSANAENVIIRDEIPANLSFVDPAPTGCTYLGKVATCSLATMSFGSVASKEFRVSVGVGTGTFSNVATATYSGPVGSLEATSNIQTLEYEKLPTDLGLDISFDETAIDENGGSTFNVSVTNFGIGSDNAFSVELQVPEGLIPNPSGPCGVVTNQFLTCNASNFSDPDLAPGETGTISIEFSTLGTSALEITGEVTSSATDGDPNSENNFGSALLIIVPSTPIPEQTFTPGLNTAPIVEDITAETDQGTAVVIDVSEAISDTEFDELEVVDTTTPTNESGTITQSGTALTFKPASEFSGETSFDFTVSDFRGAQTTGTITVTVYPNELPAAGGGSFLERIARVISNLFS